MASPLSSSTFVSPRVSSLHILVQISNFHSTSFYSSTKYCTMRSLQSPNYNWTKSNFFINERDFSSLVCTSPTPRHLLIRGISFSWLLLPSIVARSQLHSLFTVRENAFSADSWASRVSEMISTHKESGGILLNLKSSSSAVYNTLCLHSSLIATHFR